MRLHLVARVRKSRFPFPAPLVQLRKPGVCPAAQFPERVGDVAAGSGEEVEGGGVFDEARDVAEGVYEVMREGFGGGVEGPGQSLPAVVFEEAVLSLHERLDGLGEWLAERSFGGMIGCGGGSYNDVPVGFEKLFVGGRLKLIRASGFDLVIISPAVFAKVGRNECRPVLPSHQHAETSQARW